jgi:hypothetical protein
VKGKGKANKQTRRRKQQGIRQKSFKGINREL